MSDHIVTAYDKELGLLGRKIAEMGGIAEKMLSDAMDALSGLDVELAQQVVSSDARLDLLQRHGLVEVTPHRSSSRRTR